MAKTTTKTKKEENKVSQSIEISEVLELVKQIQEENNSLKKELQHLREDSDSTPVRATLEATSNNDSVNSNIAKLIENLSNSRSNREVTIIHNAELFGGLMTVMNLGGIEVTLSRLGEQRTLSWAQFEEMCSKYRGFLDKGIIQLAPQHRDMCDKYHMQCFESQEGTIKLVLSDLERSGDLSTEDLEKFFLELDSADQHTLLDYWLGKCYARPEDRDKRFYDRYKLELLNRISESFVFDNIIADMNHQS